MHTFLKLAKTAWRFPESAAFAAAAKFAPTCAAFWCKVYTAKMSPKNIPVRIKPMPPRSNKRRAPIAESPASSDVLATEFSVNVWDMGRADDPRLAAFPLDIRLLSVTLRTDIPIQISGRQVTPLESALTSRAVFTELVHL